MNSTEYVNEGIERKKWQNALHPSHATSHKAVFVCDRTANPARYVGCACFPLQASCQVARARPLTLLGIPGTPSVQVAGSSVPVYRRVQPRVQKSSKYGKNKNCDSADTPRPLLYLPELYVRFSYDPKCPLQTGSIQVPSAAAVQSVLISGQSC